MYIFLRKILLKEEKERSPFGVPSDTQETEEVKGIMERCWYGSFSVCERPCGGNKKRKDTRPGNIVQPEGQYRSTITVYPLCQERRGCWTQKKDLFWWGTQIYNVF
jgi:hypothetical protein